MIWSNPAELSQTFITKALESETSIVVNQDLIKSLATLVVYCLDFERGYNSIDQVLQQLSQSYQSYTGKHIAHVCMSLH